MCVNARGSKHVHLQIRIWVFLNWWPHTGIACFLYWLVQGTQLSCTFRSFQLACQRDSVGDSFLSLSPRGGLPLLSCGARKAPMLFVGRKSRAVQFSSPSPGPLQTCPRGSVRCDFSQRARRSVICGLCLVALLSHLGLVWRP